jgi:putative flippase GtrA
MAKLFTKERLGSLVRFGLGGLLSSGVAMGTTATLHELGSASEQVAAAVGLVCALVVNFIVLRYFIFRGTQMPIVSQLLTFIASSGFFRGIEYLGFLVINAIPGVHYLVALIIVLGGSFLLKFVVYEGWVFARHRSSVGSSETNRRSGAP